MLLSGHAPAEVGDVTLSTDHEQYPGEGAFQTPVDCVAWATRGKGTAQDQALALFQWLLTHQWHLASPQEWNMPGVVPGERPDDSEMAVYDANRGRFSYGYGLCGTVHAWNEAYWAALGLDARRRAFPGHTNSEVKLNGKWRVFDTDMAGIVFNTDGSVAGYDDIVSNLDLLTRPQQPWPRYPFAWPSDFETMQKGWQQVAEGGSWYKLYNGGYAVHPPIVHLRSGELFTRYFGPDAFGGPAKRRFWHQQPGGPQRDWTFANNGQPFHDGEKSNSRGDVRFGNAVFEYEPDLSAERFLEGVVEHSENLMHSPQGLQSSDSLEASVSFEHFSPYVICGDPADDRDPMQGAASDGLVVSGRADGAVEIFVSPDSGQRWERAGEVDGVFQLDLTDSVKGRYGWWLRLRLRGDARITALRMVTACQMSQAIYPRLSPGGSRVVYRAGSRAVVPVLPRLQEEADTVERYERLDGRSPNIRFLGRASDQRLAYGVDGPDPGSLIFRIPARTPLVGLAAAARFSVRSPTPAGARFQLDYSLDGAKSWRPLGDVQPPEDNEFSSGWVYGTNSFSTPSPQEVLVRVTLFGGGYATGLMTAEMYGLRRTQHNSSVEVTYRWQEEQRKRSYSFTIPAGEEEFQVEIPTGERINDHSVTMRCR